MELHNLRVRHTMLLGVYTQMKNYLECISRGYLGEISGAEESLLAEFQDNIKSMDKVLWHYFDREAKILE